MSKVLDGKVALVTGGSRGIGAATALRLADDGADVAISYSASSDRAERVVEQLESKGVRAAAFRADQGQPEQAAALLRNVVGEFGRLDILVNNAASVVVAAGRRRRDRRRPIRPPVGRELHRGRRRHPRGDQAHARRRSHHQHRVRCRHPRSAGQG